MKKDIRIKLLLLKNDAYKQFYKKLCSTKYEILGINLPTLRNIAKEISKENWKEYLDNPYNKYYEEVMIQGLIIGYIKAPIDIIWNYVETFVPKIDNWAVCDSFCNTLKIVKKNRKFVFNRLTKYIYSKNEFEIRFAIIILLCYFLEKEYIDKVLAILKNIPIHDYYVEMAIAWTLAEAYISFPEKVELILLNKELDFFTHNKAIQKINESYRVDKISKDKIKELRIMK